MNKRRRVENILIHMTDEGEEEEYAAMRTGEAASSTSLSLRSAASPVGVATCTCHYEYTEGACEQGTSSRQHFHRHEGRRTEGGVTPCVAPGHTEPPQSLRLGPRDR